jgi:hypothetical protein
MQHEGENVPLQSSGTSIVPEARPVKSCTVLVDDIWSCVGTGVGPPVTESRARGAVLIRDAGRAAVGPYPA